MNIPLVAVSIVTQRISNADLSSIDSVSAVEAVGDCDVVDFVDRSEVHSPPGSIIMLCVSYGRPAACTSPINSILRPSDPICR